MLSGGAGGGRGVIMDAGLYCPESELGGSDKWFGPGTGSEPGPDHLTGASWQDRSDDGFEWVKGMVGGVCLFLPLKGVIIGRDIFLFKT